MKRKYADPTPSIITFLEQHQREQKQRRVGHSMAQICRGINCQLNPLYCGRRKCGFPNPRKRKRFTLYEHSCQYPYSSVTRNIRKLGKEDKVRIKTELRFDKFKSGGADDPRRIVRLIGGMGGSGEDCEKFTGCLADFVLSAERKIQSPQLHVFSNPDLLMRKLDKNPESDMAYLELMEALKKKKCEKC